MNRNIRQTVVSDVGLLRPNNEDNFLLGHFINETCAPKSALTLGSPRTPSGWLLAGVFDGMGGGEKGELAALTTAQAFRDTLSRLTDDLDGNGVDGLLRFTFQQANNQILGMQGQWGMYGTTGTLACIRGNLLKIYHLGDSRAYLLRSGTLYPLTRDHTLAQLKLDAGILQPGDPALLADRNKLTEYIGMDETGENLYPEESPWMEIFPGDTVLLCTDGLYDMVPEETVREIMTTCSEDTRIPGALVARALERGGRDNVTCVCLNI